MNLAVVLEALSDDPLDDALEFLRALAPAVTGLEVDVGGYAPARHCDMRGMLRDAVARRKFAAHVSSFGFTISALNAWGNPLHPEPEVAQRHRDDLIEAVRLAVDLGVDRVVALAGCPAASLGERTPAFAAGGWLPYLEGGWDRQWREVVEMEWTKIVAAAEAESKEMRICLELHPGTVVYNVDTFLRVAEIGPSIAANLDPSHLFWMQMDPLVVIERLGPLIGYSHAKDTVFDPQELALNGVLDRRWPAAPDHLAWTFAVPGRGHDRSWWTGFVQALTRTSAHTLSIEMEDPFVSARDGIAEASSFLERCGAGATS